MSVDTTGPRTLDDADLRMVRDGVAILVKVIEHGDVAATERGQLMAARDLVVEALRQPRSEPAHSMSEDDDPRCTCGVHRSEHALCGCPDGFRVLAEARS